MKIKLARLFATSFMLALPFSVAAMEPEWTLSGETRIRYETLDGQFRAFGVGGDQIIASRTLLRGDLNFKEFDLVAELHDARTYLDDEGTPLSTSFVNTADLLQGYLGKEVGWGTYVRLGRFTLDIASRRFVERNDFRNTINSYTGIHSTHRLSGNGQVDLFFTVPVRKESRLRNDLDSNHWELDREDDHRRFWGAHWQQPSLFGDIQGDLFVYGLYETDESPSPDRKVYAPGFRLLKPQRENSFDFDLEAAYRFGSRSESNSPTARKLDVRAHMFHAELGYTFDNAWQTRISIEYDIATGDDDPTDREYGRYERFFGTRRGDLGNTSIHGPLTRSNISVAGLRLMFKKARVDGRVIYQHASLDAARDAWIVARVADPSGDAGKFIGHTLDFRVRYWMVPKRLRLEVGGSALWHGDFAQDAPNAPSTSRTLFGYSQLTLTF